MSEFVISALYQFKTFPAYKEARDDLLTFCKNNNIKGTLLASEGINGTIAGTEAGINAVKEYLENTLSFTNLEYKISYQTDGKEPFSKLKIKLKKEIVTLGVQGIDPTQEVGRYVNPEQWNDLIQDPDVILVDTRNHYEFKIGSFKGAVDPVTDNFRQFPQWVDTNLDSTKHKKVAMFCTGGIRCEKATALMLQQGFEEVYHLKGGILQYLENIAPEDSLWEGECFVFDNRVAVNHKLQPGEHVVCFGCGEPLSPEEVRSRDYEKGICCPNCISDLSTEKRQRRLSRAAQRD